MTDALGNTIIPVSNPPNGAVIEAKFHPPPLVVEHVARRRLIELLDASVARPLTLVTAPTGFGKSTLLAEWCGQAGASRRYAWLSLDEEDNDPIVFWSYLLHAVRRLEPTLFGHELRALQTADASFTHIMLPSVLNSLWSVETPLVVVLDDYHYVSAVACHDTMQYFLNHLPPKVRVVIATRIDPPLELATLRARGELAEVRDSDLSFTTAESSIFLVERLEMALSPADVQQLTQRTEGWPAGIYLGALSLRKQTDASAFISTFTGSNRHVVDYLGGEVLDRSPEDVRTFLLRTAILDSFSAQLCAALLDDVDASTLLAEVERTNLFLIPLDLDRHWYRYHHLFQAFLRTTLEHLDPDLVSDLHRRAAVWYRDSGDIGAAMRHSLAGQDFDLAGRLFVQHWNQFVITGRLATVHSWLNQMPDKTIAASPSLALAVAWVASTVRRPQFEVERYIALGSDGELDGPLPLDASSVQSAIVLLRGIYPYDDAGQVLTAARMAVAEEVDPSRRAYSLARAALALALYLAGRPTETRTALEDVLHSPLVHTQPVVRIAARAVLALTCLNLDEPTRAEELARQAAAEAAEASLTPHPNLWWIPVAQGRTLMRSGKMAEAQRVLSEGLEHRLPMLQGRPLAYAEVLLTLAQARFGCGHPQNAWPLVEEARTVLARCADPGMLSTMLAETERAGGRRPRRTLAVRSDLSEAELRVMRMLDSDLTQREIGQELFLSLNTVRTHTRSIYAKLDVNGREDAVARARSQGLID